MQAINYDSGQSLLQSPAGTPAAGSLNTGTYVSADQQNIGRRGIKLIVDITANTTGTITVTLQGKDPLSGKYYTILTSAALAGTGTTVLTVYPGATASANVSASDVLPATWRISAVINTAALTATIGASLIV